MFILEFSHESVRAVTNTAHFEEQSKLQWDRVSADLDSSSRFSICISSHDSRKWKHRIGVQLWCLLALSLSCFSLSLLSLLLELCYVLTKIQWDVWRVDNSTCLKKTQELWPHIPQGHQMPKVEAIFTMSK